MTTNNPIMLTDDPGLLPDVVINEEEALPNRYLGGRPRVMSYKIKCAYLEKVRETGLLDKSAVDVGVCGDTARANRKNDEEFALAVDDAMKYNNDLVRGEIFRRGVLGVEEPVFYQGEICGHIKKYSDKLIELEAKRRMPEYRDRVNIDATVQHGVVVIPAGPQAVEDWSAQNDAPLEVVDVQEVKEIPAERETERA